MANTSSYKMYLREETYNSMTKEYEYGDPIEIYVGYPNARGVKPEVEFSLSVRSIPNEWVSLYYDTRGTDLLPLIQKSEENNLIKYYAFDESNTKLGFYIAWEYTSRDNRVVLTMANDEVGICQVCEFEIESQMEDFGIFLYMPFYWSVRDNLFHIDQMADYIIEESQKNLSISYADYEHSPLIFVGLWYEYDSDVKIARTEGNSPQFMLHNLEWLSSWYRLLNTNTGADAFIKGSEMFDLPFNNGKDRLYLTMCDANKTQIITPDDSAGLIEPLYWMKNPVLGTSLTYLFEKYGNEIVLDCGTVISGGVFEHDGSKIKAPIIISRSGTINEEEITVEMRAMTTPTLTYISPADSEGSISLSANNVEWESWISAFRRQHWSIMPYSGFDDGPQSGDTYIMISKDYNGVSTSNMKDFINNKTVEDWTALPDRVISVLQTFDTLYFKTFRPDGSGPDFTVAVSNYMYTYWTEWSTEKCYAGSVNELLTGSINVDSADKWNFLLDFDSSIQPIEPPQGGGGSIGGGNNKRGGGKGGFDDSTTPIGIPDEPIGYSAGKMLSQWYIGNTDSNISDNLNSLGEWLTVDILDYGLSDKLKHIVSLKLVYSYSIPHCGSNGQIKINAKGWKNTGAHGAKLTSQFIQIDLGKFTVPRYFDSFLDYKSKYQIYLPFAGTFDLNPDDVVGNECNLICYVDFMYSNVYYILSVKDSLNGQSAVRYRFSGNSGVEIPISADDYGRKISSMIQGVVGGAVAVGTIVATGGASAAATGLSMAGGSGVISSIGNIASGLMQESDVSTSGMVAGPVGSMDVKYPYLIISRPKMAIPEAYGTIQGYPSNISMPLADVTGFAKIKELHLDNISGATSDEIDEIESLLKDGVIF